MTKCHLCYGAGIRCWVCGEVDVYCECEAPNMGACDWCRGTGEEPDVTGGAT